ncbi:DsbA family protein [Aestuariibius insulae]|uniref:DsbA family protein n=1 Tax=Aestuariibius insulae TaxID=2058287 RepID=UPI00345E18E7
MLKRRAVLALGGAAFVGGGAYLLTRPMAGDQTFIGAVEAQQAADVDTSGIIEMVQGAEDAPVTITEYASFTCPHCATFHANQYPQLKEEFIDTGKVRFTYRDVYFDRPGLWAAMIARCDPNRFFGIAGMLYERQGEWTQGDGPTIAENLKRIGIAAGLDAERVEACLADGDTAQALVAWYQQNAAADNVQATPTLVVNGETMSNMSYEDLKAVIEEELGS